MSGSYTTDGDDTDALLIIPPDFFLHEESDDSSNSRFRRPLPQQCVKHLAQKVDSLQTRLMHMQDNVSNSESYERSPFRPISDISFTPSSQKQYSNSKPKHTNRFKRSRRRLELPPIVRHDPDLSSDSDISSSLMNTPELNSDGSIIGEIDTFLGTVGSLNFRSDPVDNVSVRSKRSPLLNVDNLLSKYIYLTGGQSENVSRSNEMENPLRIANESINHVGSEQKSDVNTQTLIDQQRNTQFFYNKKENLSPTAYRSKINTDFALSTNNMSSNHQKGASSNVSLVNSVIDITKMTYDDPESTLVDHKLNEASSRPDKSLPSLYKLWNDSGSTNQNVTDKGSVEKFEEERMRRQHCEEVIQTLQKKLLEQQQKLAVAVQLDSAKDEVIQRLKDMIVAKSQEWKNAERKYVDQVACVQSQSKSISNENIRLKNKIKENDEEIAKYERNIHEIEEKLKTAFDNVEHEKSELNKKIDAQLCIIAENEKCISELKESSEMLNRLNKQLSDNMIAAQRNIDEMKNEEKDCSERLKESKATLLCLQDEISILKKEKNDLESKMSEDKTKNSQLIDENMSLKSDLETANEKYNELHRIFDDFKALAEAQKCDMKVYYQRKSESIVTEKVNEFQRQLDLARNLMAKEIQAKEKEVAFQFAKHLHRIENAQQLEVNTLEGKHREEIRFLTANLNLLKKTIQNLQDKLALHKSKRGEIASQLHTVMENQWQQALKIILNSTADLSNVTLSSMKNAETDEPTVIRKTNNESSKESNGLLDNSDEKINEMPKAVFKNGDKLTDEQLNRYAKLLLQKLPNVSDSSEGPCHSKTDCKTKNDNAVSKNVNDVEYPTSDRSNENGDKKLHRIKPPWK